jgi:hypothetical protein
MLHSYDTDKAEWLTNGNGATWRPFVPIPAVAIWVGPQAGRL